jgi:hypothetical protein
MNIKSSVSHYNKPSHKTPAATASPIRSSDYYKRKIYMGDALVGAVQGAIEGSTGIFTGGGDFARAPLSLCAGVGITAKTARGGRIQAKLACSALRSCAYGAAGAIFGPTGGLVTVGVGAVVGATLAALQTRSEFAERGW